eukprot:767803-Hanusia_phi.AAC.7
MMVAMSPDLRRLSLFAAFRLLLKHCLKTLNLTCTRGLLFRCQGHWSLLPWDSPGDCSLAAEPSSLLRFNFLGSTR